MPTTIYIVTPCFNAAETIDRTILSVVSQAGNFRIRYHVQDGCSTDETVERLKFWQSEIDSGRFPIQNLGVYFSYSTEPDTGMYDALIRGFEAMCIPKNSFMAWINADDVLMTGSCAFISAISNQFTRDQISWVGGSVAIVRDDMIISTHDRHISSEALRNGLSDGKHWPFVQQEGTYFRKWLWDAAQPRVNLLPMRLAGDWNLWRLFAQHASLVQAPMALGGFRLRDQQLSAKHRDKYLLEMDANVTTDIRAQKLKEMVERGSIMRRKVRGKFPGSILSVYEDSAYEQARASYKSVFRADPPKPTQPYSQGERLLHEGKALPKFDSIVDEMKKYVYHDVGLSIFDHGWQFPAITEHHAALRMRAVLASQSSSQYIAYPWATLIDKIESNAKDCDAWLTGFREFFSTIPKGSSRITICQHIHARKYTNLFKEAGISIAFWSHATPDDLASPEDGAEVKFLPFPLYPVQVPQALPEAAPEADAAPRPHLFSFIGARANQHYLTEARNWILDLLKDDPRGMIIGRDSWHYQKVVYDLQVRGKGDETQSAALVDGSASDQFRQSLLNSTFSLCPAGSGPNSIRLWESLGAGSIPVVLADTWAPPGDRRLWELAVVFCKETPEAIKALPDRLAEIAADPARLARMRHAMRQLWLLYGPQNFVNDVQEFLLAHAGAGPAAAAAPGLPAPPTAPPESADAARHLLLAWSSRLLLDPAGALAALAATPGLSAALDGGCDLLAETGLPAHFRAVLDHARTHDGAPVARPRAAAILRGAAPKIAFLGRHSHRTPLSYAAVRQMVGDRLAWAAEPGDADLIVTGFNIDWRENLEQLAPLLARPAAPKLAVISEEPLWDVTWSGPFTGREGRMTVKDTEIRYAFLGHETSEIYQFDRLPYFVLTEDHYAVRYASMMARFAGMAPAELLKRWQSAPVAAAFFAEKREGDAYAGSFPERDVTRLSGYRSQVAALSNGAGVLCVGKGWGAEVKRQDLPDWHLDKLAQLDGRVRMATAFENVHQHNYISEKIFDAFAVGGVPVYWAGSKHRIFDLVPATAMLNTVGLEPAAAARRIAGFTPDLALAESWLETCARLAGLFGDFQAIAAERRRVADAVVGEVLGLV